MAKNCEKKLRTGRVIDAGRWDHPTPTSILNHTRSTLSAMDPTGEVQERNSRGIPKAPFIVSFTDGQPWRVINRKRRLSLEQPPISRHMTVGRREIHWWTGRRR